MPHIGLLRRKHLRATSARFEILADSITCVATSPSTLSECEWNAKLQNCDADAETSVSLLLTMFLHSLA